MKQEALVSLFSLIAFALPQHAVLAADLSKMSFRLKVLTDEESRAGSMNAHGEVAYSTRYASAFGESGFYYDGESISEIPGTAGAVAISDNGTVLALDNDYVHGLWSSGGSSLERLPVPADAIEMRLSDLNDSNRAVGYATRLFNNGADYDKAVVVRNTPSGFVTEYLFTNDANGKVSYGNAINNNGVVVGYYKFGDRRGFACDSSQGPIHVGGNGSIPCHLSQSVQITYLNSDGDQASGGRTADTSEALGINDAGWVVGTVKIAGESPRAFYRAAGSSVLYAVGDFLNGGFTQVRTHSGRDINARNIMVGKGWREGYEVGFIADAGSLNPLSARDLNQMLRDEDAVTYHVSDALSISERCEIAVNYLTAGMGSQQRAGVLVPNVEGDISGDQVVDFTDLNSLLIAFGSSNSEADIDGDGVVTFSDLNALLSNFGSSAAC